MSVALRGLRKNLLKSYSNGAAERAEVPDLKISWDVSFPEYSPSSYTLPIISSNSVPWADPDLNSKEFRPQWNQLEDNSKIDRRSLMTDYVVSTDGPLNPAGRTGLRGRGRLGRWGPNHACDPILTRWKKEGSEFVKTQTGQPILQFVAIQRRDTQEWAIPGGMIDPGEDVRAALLREFMEEVFSFDELPELDRDKLKVVLCDIFKNDKEIYRGYIDDPRNTDNAWIESRAFNFHDEQDVLFKIPFKAGSDAMNAKWIDVDNSVSLYASHTSLIRAVADKWQAFW